MIAQRVKGGEGERGRERGEEEEGESGGQRKERREEDLFTYPIYLYLLSCTSKYPQMPLYTFIYRHIL